MDKFIYERKGKDSFFFLYYTPQIYLKTSDARTTQAEARLHLGYSDILLINPYTVLYFQNTCPKHFSYKYGAKFPKIINIHLIYIQLKLQHMQMQFRYR